MRAADLDVPRVGRGPAIVFVHGSIVGPERAWRKQLDLARNWELWLPNRPGFGSSPPLARGDFELEAPLIAELLGDGAHLVGHSYGAVIALLAAARRPQATHSLVVSEPGLLNLAAGEPTADAMIERGERLYRMGAGLPPGDFLRHFRAGVHSTRVTPDELPEWLERGARHAARERPSWHAEIPFTELAAMTFPKLVISGGHSTVFEAVCDTVAEEIGGERAVLPGRDHTIPGLGEVYNCLVEDFLRRTEASGT